MSRLLIIDPGLHLWGSERALLATIPDLVAAYEAIVAVVPPGAALASKLAPSGIMVFEKGIDNLGRGGAFARVRIIFELVALCIRKRIDVVYVNQAGLCRIVSVVARLLGKRLIVHVRIAEDLARVARLPATAKSPVDAILISRDMVTRFGSHADGKRHFGVHFAYDVFDEPRALTKSIRCDDAFVCLGRIVKTKGQLELAEALAMLIRRGVSASLDFIGAASQEPDYGQRVLAVITSASLESRVKFHGYVDGAAERLGKYAFVVVSTYHEALGRTVLEGWNAGCVPICSANSGGAAEIVIQSGGGLTYDGFEPASLADAMLRALALTHDERQELVRLGRLWMAQNTSRSAYRAALSGSLFPSGPVAQPIHR